VTLRVEEMKFGHRRKRGPAIASRAPRAGAKRTLMYVIKQLPTYLRMLFGLMRDHRVAMLDKLLVVGAIAYIVSPFDFIPDFIPFVGQVDDVFLLMTAVQRLVANAGRRVLLDHWGGDPVDLDDLNLQRIVSAAAFFLPSRMRKRLRRAARARV
jgi:uncharacterized membrane protein YkvA (DUF1232 family)